MTRFELKFLYNGMLYGPDLVQVVFRLSEQCALIFSDFFRPKYRSFDAENIMDFYLTKVLL